MKRDRHHIENSFAAPDPVAGPAAALQSDRPATVGRPQRGTVTAAGGGQPAAVRAEVDTVWALCFETNLGWALPQGVEGQSPHLGVVHLLEAGDGIRELSGRVRAEPLLGLA